MFVGPGLVLGKRQGLFLNDRKWPRLSLGKPLTLGKLETQQLKQRGIEHIKSRLFETLMSEGGLSNASICKGQQTS